MGLELTRMAVLQDHLQDTIKGAICGLHGGRWRLEWYLYTIPDGYNWTRHPTPVSDYFHDR
ncbi:MAG: hypothetical protein VYB08_19110, partial [Candidatus Latescibacterota bacterium]|nr:hypothetical protein [Candidatus Latescibacterota bacterium]